MSVEHGGLSMGFQLPRLWTPGCEALLRGFNKEGVEYLLFGSMAKALHCPDLTHPKDMDVMINSTPENAKKVMSVFGKLLPSVDERAAKRLAERGQQIPPLFRGADVRTPPKEGFSFREAAARSTEELIPHVGIPVRIAAMCDLKTLDLLK